MKKAHWAWKPPAIAICLFVAGNVIFVATRPHASVASWVAVLSLSLAAAGLLQYAFSWPRLPRMLWRIFGPIFSMVMIWPLASGIGWLGARLVLRRLTMGDQIATISLIALLAGYCLVIVVPLFRLGEWKHLKGPAPDEKLISLTDTFA